MRQLSDPYRALGVARGASDVEIKAAHRKLVKRYHPDSGSKSDTDRFLRVQEAYRVLSDPLLRREWDARHAPGPLRADKPPRPSQRTRPAAPPSATAAQPAAARPKADRRTEPRSNHAYTWSAGEVPWWEDAGRRPAKGTRSQPRSDDPPPRTEAPLSDTQDFDVYNRSSGAAWSMAARAYFRRGDEELPRRGSWHHEGSQPLTAARARTAAEHAARRSAGATAAQAASRPQPQPRVAPQPVFRPTHTAAWPSLGQRLGFALIAWLPIVGLAIYAGSVAPNEEIGMLTLIVASLLVLFVMPRLAYLAGVATIGLFIVGAVFIGALAFAGVGLPLSAGLTASVLGALAVGYIATAGLVLLGPPSLRPWTRGAK